jgi:hypothetical protein
MVKIQKQNARLRSPLFSGVWSLVTGCLAPDKTFRPLKMRPTCLETSGTNHPVTQSHNPEEASLRKPPAGVLNSRACVNVRTDGLSMWRGSFVQLSGISSHPVLWNSTCYRTQTCEFPSAHNPRSNTAMHTLRSPSATRVHPATACSRRNEWASLSLSLSLSFSLSLAGPVPLLARVLNTEETNKYQL